MRFEEAVKENKDLILDLIASRLDDYPEDEWFHVDDSKIELPSNKAKKF